MKKKKKKKKKKKSQYPYGLSHTSIYMVIIKAIQLNFFQNTGQTCSLYVTDF